MWAERYILVAEANAEADAERDVAIEDDWIGWMEQG
jgi:hypothetical protein